ncbi:hypothetical protein Taro_022389 [Colocasia esculenta]|uniref:Uncharacterized protein n=1 Tax=Colocasia esculenta TaxID=4460 RepID=A0A843V1Q9_COLES|nr:hypothetical protein [Colocasia esculenta]
MPSTEYQGASSPLASVGRSILSIRRDQVHSMDSPHDGGAGGAGDHQLESFQRHVAELFHGLADGGGGGGGGGEDLLSLSWVRKLLEAFLVCQEEFRGIVLGNRGMAARPPLDRLVGEFFERGVKALDVCNAVRDGIEQVRQWRKHMEIVLVALDPGQRAVGEGQLRRARKALTDLTIAMLDEKEAGSAIAQRNRSFGRNNAGRDHHHRSLGRHFRSLSWSVSRSWSAARQLQAIGSNLTAPRSNEIIATNGIAIHVYTMNTVLLFVMWALVAAIPCQDRGLQTHFSVPKNLLWAAPITLLHERILEESKKKERRNSNGLLMEIYGMEKCSRHLAELTDPSQYPLVEDKEAELRQWVQELSQVCDSLNDGLDKLERQVREVFHRIVRNRMDGMDCLGLAAI